jgi:hypothetical protein
LSVETIAAAGYAGFLVVFALLLDGLGRHTHERSGRFRTQGFRYDPALDLWECPEGEQLRPFAVDHHRRIARYRARPVVCNGCPAKENCTDSEHGREIARSLDPWPHSEAGRFHRGISVVLIAAATLIVLAAIAAHPDLPDLLPLAAMLLVTGVLGVRLGLALAAMPSGFPEGSARTIEGRLPR